MQMKMSAALYAMLESDCHTLCRAGGVEPEAVTTRAAAWAWFHRVVFQRGMSDRHPHFRDGGQRFLPFDQEGEDDPRINGNPYLGRFYEVEDLNDTHIWTALKRVFPNAR